MKTLVLALLVLHVLLGTARVPGVVIARRLDDVAEFERRGAPRFFLDSPRQRGAAAVEWILANVPADAVVLYRGDSKGSIEFVPGLIAPRLLVRADACPADDGYHGRPLARRSSRDGGKVLVVAALGDDLRLEDR